MNRSNKVVIWKIIKGLPFNELVVGCSCNTEPSHYEMALNVDAAALPVLSSCLCVQLFQAEQRLHRSQQQLKDLRQAATDANPESECPCPGCALCQAQLDG